MICSRATEGKTAYPGGAAAVRAAYPPTVAVACGARSGQVTARARACARGVIWARPPRMGELIRWWRPRARLVLIPGGASRHGAASACGRAGGRGLLGWLFGFACSRFPPCAFRIVTGDFPGPAVRPHHPSSRPCCLMDRRFASYCTIPFTNI